MAITSVSTAVVGHAKAHNAADLIPSSGSPSALVGFQAGAAIEFDWDSAAATATTIAARDSNGDIIVPTTPTVAGAAASKSYVDASFQGLSDRKEASRAASTVALSTWSFAGTGVGKTLTSPNNNVSNNDFDGVTLVVNDRVLIKDGGPSSNLRHNGIYTLTQAADGASNPAILTRATDFDDDADVNAGSSTWVSEGSTLADTFWAVSEDDPITVDNAAPNQEINFVQVGGASGITAGNGIDKTGSTISADVDGTSLINTGGGGDQLAIAALGVDTAELAAGAVTEAKTSFRDADVTLAGASPVIADFTGASMADGEEALGEGTNNSLWLMAVRNIGGVKYFAVQLGEITS